MYTLHDAVNKNNVKLVHQLIAQGADVNLKKRYTELTPLHVAAEHGHVECALALLKAGAEMDAKDAFGDTPLFCAVATKQNKYAVALLHAGANMYERNAYDYSLLVVCVCRKNDDMVSYLLNQAGYKMSAKDGICVDTLINLNYMNSVKVLIEHGASVYEPFVCGYPLFVRKLVYKRKLLLAAASAFRYNVDLPTEIWELLYESK